MRVRAKSKKPIDSLKDMFQGDAWKNDRHYQILIERVEEANNPRLTSSVIRFIDSGLHLVNAILSIEHPRAKGFAVQHAFIDLKEESGRIKYANSDIQQRALAIVTRKLRNYNIQLAEEKKQARLDKLEYEQPSNFIDAQGNEFRFYDSDNLQ